MLDTETAWARYLEGNYCMDSDDTAETGNSSVEPAAPCKQRRRSSSWDNEPPQALASHTSTCGALYISTKTKIGYLNQTIPLDSVFWQLPVSQYHIPCEGVIKKQMKFNSASQKALDILRERITKEQETSKVHMEDHVLTHIENPGGRIPFKDVRKISAGLCKKDVTSYRAKRKGAFYNCLDRKSVV